MQRQAGLVMQQPARDVLQGLHRQRELVLFQRGGQRVVPAVFADAGAVGGLAGGRDAGHRRRFPGTSAHGQPGQRVAHAVAGREFSSHGQRPGTSRACPSARVRAARRARSSNAGLRCAAARHQQGEIGAADPGQQRLGAALRVDQPAQAVGGRAQPLVGERTRQVAVDLRWCRAGGT